jgi:hypothetical protein
MAWEEPRKTGMQYRRLGSSGLHVSVLGLGGWLTYVSVGREGNLHANEQSDSVVMLRMVNASYNSVIRAVINICARTHILVHETGL